MTCTYYKYYLIEIANNYFLNESDQKFCYLSENKDFNLKLWQKQCWTNIPNYEIAKQIERCTLLHCESLWRQNFFYVCIHDKIIYPSFFFWKLILRVLGNLFSFMCLLDLGASLYLCNYLIWVSRILTESMFRIFLSFSRWPLSKTKECYLGSTKPASFLHSVKHFLVFVHVFLLSLRISSSSFFSNHSRALFAYSFFFFLVRFLCYINFFFL